jgi:hypothetical protein
MSTWVWHKNWEWHIITTLPWTSASPTVIAVFVLQWELVLLQLSVAHTVLPGTCRQRTHRWSDRHRSPTATPCHTLRVLLLCRASATRALRTMWARADGPASPLVGRLDPAAQPLWHQAMTTIWPGQVGYFGCKLGRCAEFRPMSRIWIQKSFSLSQVTSILIQISKIYIYLNIYPKFMKQVPLSF